jgi:hypothetical protein
MDRVDHSFAIRLYADELRIEQARTTEGKEFYLLNLPYFLGTQLPKYIKWFISKIDSSTEKKVGTSYSFLLVGDKPIYKRQVTIRSIDGEFNFIQATSKAILLGFMAELLDYFENEKGYKDGGYIDR